MMKLRVSLLVFLLFMTSNILAQHNSTVVKLPRNMVYIEAGGNSIIYSFNYERVFVQKPAWQFSGRIGFGCFPTINGAIPGIIVPVEGVFSISKTKHKFEIGLAVSNYIYFDDQIDGTYIPPGTTIRDRTFLLGVAPSFGYRYEKPEGGFFLRAGITPSWYFNLTSAFNKGVVFPYPIPMPKVGIGYKFK